MAQKLKLSKAHTFPLSGYLCKLLSNQKSNASCDNVFASTSENSYIVESRKQMAKIIKETEIRFTVHDFRRTFITITENLNIFAYDFPKIIQNFLKPLMMLKLYCLLNPTLTMTAY